MHLLPNIKSYMLPFWNLWPPFLFSGIKIVKKSKDYRHIEVKLKLRFWNSNYVGTQYGGAMFSLVDPFYMVMLMRNLGPDYVVWDKEATIHYLKPGRTDLFAEFNLGEDDLNYISQNVDEQHSIDWQRKVEIRDKNGVVIAEVDKTIFIRKRRTK